jgi:hypothetical protein
LNVYDTIVKSAGYNDPVQGKYRSMEAGPVWNYGGFGQNEAAGVGFSGASLDEVYLNFYVRKRNSNTKSMFISIYSKIPEKFNGRTVYIYSTLDYTYTFPANGSASQDPQGLVSQGVVMDEMGWNLVSVKLSDMTPHDIGKPTFDPSKIVQIQGGGLSASTGFDMDFIVFTRGVPFNQIK